MPARFTEHMVVASSEEAAEPYSRGFMEIVSRSYDGIERNTERYEAQNQSRERERHPCHLDFWSHRRVSLFADPTVTTLIAELSLCSCPEHCLWIQYFAIRVDVRSVRYSSVAPSGQLAAPSSPFGIFSKLILAGAGGTG
jgi:hypothetical protein